MSCRKKLEELADRRGSPPDGWMQLRVDSPAGMALHLAVRHPDICPALIIDVPEGAEPAGWRVPAVRGFQLVRGGGSLGKLRLVVVASQPSFWDPFVVVADDVLAVLGAVTGPAPALVALAKRLEMWARFFDRAPTGHLGRAERLGLIAELYLMDRHLVSGAGARAIDGWLGPESAPHDFVIGSTAIEAKCTTAQQPIQLEISSARQLDDDAFEKLYLFALCLAEGPTGAVSLPGLVSGIRKRVTASHPEAAARFEDLLIQSGYSDTHVGFYSDERFSVKAEGFFLVRDGFPRIREAALPPGLGHVRYCIDWSACRAFETTAGTVIQGL